MDGDGPDQRDGQCGWKFGVRGDDGRGISGVGDLERVDRRRIDWDELGRVGTYGVVLAGWRDERGGAAGGEHGSRSVGGAGRAVETDLAPERQGAVELGREPQRALDGWGHAGRGMADAAEGLRPGEKISAGSGAARRAIVGVRVAVA